MSRSPPHPRSRKTPSGGRMMAKMNLQMSLQSTQLAKDFSGRSLRAIQIDCFAEKRDSEKRTSYAEEQTYEAVKGIVC